MDITLDHDIAEVTEEEGNRRLLVLADFLDTVPPERFDYSKWVGQSWKGAPDLSCGATACAFGWAATIPEFRELGLRLRPATDPEQATREHLVLEAVIDCPALGIVYERLHDYYEVDSVTLRTARKFFSLGGDGAQHLFIPGMDDGHFGFRGLLRSAGPAELAWAIRRYVDARQEEALDARS